MLMMRSFMICTLIVGTACQETSNECIGASKVRFTDHIYGCDAAWSSPGVASASAVCGSAAHICTSLEEIQEGGLADGACTSIAPAGKAYLTLIAGGPVGALGDCRSDRGTNDIWACAKDGNGVSWRHGGSCGALDRIVGDGGTSKAGFSWADHMDELGGMRSDGSSGGVLCCSNDLTGRDHTYEDMSSRWPGQPCETQADCEYEGCSDKEFTVCDVWDSDGPDQGPDEATYRCIYGETTSTCAGKPNGYGLDDGSWCWDGRRDFWCPEGLGSSKKLTYHSAPKSWSAARADCRSREGDLASIHNAAENAEAFALHVERSLPSGQSTWIGLTDAADEGHWVWSDGTPVDYTPSAGEGFRTDNHGGDEDCAGFWAGRGASNSMWDDMYGTESCSHPLPYICKGAHAEPEGLEVGAVAGIVAGVAGLIIILLLIRIILFYKKKPAASPTAVPVMQGVAMPEATPAPTTVMPVATPVQATYA